MLLPSSRYDKMEAGRFVRNVNKFLPEHMASHARRRHSFFLVTALRISELKLCSVS